MARVELVVEHTEWEFLDEVNKIIQNLKFEEFDIRYSASDAIQMRLNQIHQKGSLVL